MVYSNDLNPKLTVSSHVYNQCLTLISVILKVLETEAIRNTALCKLHMMSKGPFDVCY